MAPPIIGIILLFYIISYFRRFVKGFSKIQDPSHRIGRQLGHGDGFLGGHGIIGKGTLEDGNVAPMPVLEAAFFLNAAATEGEMLTLKPGGWHFPHGSTGLFSLGDGRYYISAHGRDERGQFSNLRLYRWDGVHPFAL